MLQPGRSLESRAGMSRSKVIAAARAMVKLGWRPGRLRRRLARARERERELEVLLRRSEQRRAELEDRLDRFGRLSGAVAHDVNNLLTVVALVASGLRGQLAPREREQADELRDSAMRAAQLNRQLLALDKPRSAGGGGAIDVNLVIEGLRRLLERLVGASLELVVDLDRRPCVVNADPSQLERVIINLVTNARDAMPTEGRLTIETARTASAPHGERGDDRSDERGDERGESVVVRVTDTGTGMDTATQRQIFGRFFTTKGAAGNGLGLAAVRDIVADCGGRVRVESRPGGGTRFEVVLPVSYAGGTHPASARSIA
jgi:two-component system, cell cycle sensor histidine kinase and response regulator CckA